MRSVFAIVVTYKRPEMLSACLESLMNQRQYGLSRIHVIVNSSDEATEHVIKRWISTAGSMLSYQRYENIGPAGGFYEGLKKFEEDSDAAFAWVMDDDIKVSDDCLLQLMISAEAHEYIYPRVFKPSGEEVISFGWWGPILSRKVVAEVGLPLRELFYWIEDTEYLHHRIELKYGHRAHRSMTAVVEHLHDRKDRFPSWYYYYTVRNTVLYRLFFQRKSLARRLVRISTVWISSFVRILMKEPRKVLKLRLMLLATYHGLFRITGKIIDPEKNH